MKELRPWPDLPTKLPRTLADSPFFTAEWLADFHRNAPERVQKFLESENGLNHPPHRQPSARALKDFERYLQEHPPQKNRDVWAKMRRESLPPIPIPRECIESQKRAENRLLCDANDWKPGDGASIGDTSIDAEKMIISEVLAAGKKAYGSWRRHFRQIWDADARLEQYLREADPKVRASAEYASAEQDLNASRDNEVQFLKGLGRALADKKKRRTLPDWDAVPKRRKLLVAGWCERIEVDKEKWPPLCCLTSPALAKFLSLCKNPLWSMRSGSDDHRNSEPYRTLEQEIRRLGLKRIPRGRIQNVDKSKTTGQFIFS